MNIGRMSVNGGRPDFSRPRQPGLRWPPTLFEKDATCIVLSHADGSHRVKERQRGRALFASIASITVCKPYIVVGGRLLGGVSYTAREQHRWAESVVKVGHRCVGAVAPPPPFRLLLQA